METSDAPVPAAPIDDPPVDAPAAQEAAALVEPAVSSPPDAVEAVQVSPEVPWTEDEWKANVGWAISMTLAIFLMFCALRFLPSVGWPLVLAAAFAYLFDPVVNALDRRGVGRTV